MGRRDDVRRGIEALKGRAARPDTCASCGRSTARVATYLDLVCEEAGVDPPAGGSVCLCRGRGGYPDLVAERLGRPL